MPDAGPLTGRQIARAAVVVMAAFVLSRLLGLAREVILAYVFGASLEFEAYLAALQLPDTLFFVVAGGALGSAFIPTFTASLSSGDRDGAWRLASAVVNLIFIVLIVLAAVAWVFAQFIVVNLLAPGYTSDQQTLAAELMRIMLLSPIIFGVSGIVMGVLNSHQRFLAAALAPSMYNLGIIGGALLLADSMGVHGLAWGVVAGAGLHLAVQVPSLARVGARYVPVLGLRDANVREVARLMGPRVAGLAVVQLNFWVNIYLASSMLPGSVAALKRGFAVMLLPQGVIAQSVATAVFPTFSALTARGETVGLRRTLAQTLGAVLFLSLPATVGLIMLRVPVVQIIFERGEFTPEDTAATA
jgi:putative peptidoglycan lipid II flippase